MTLTWDAVCGYHIQLDSDATERRRVPECDWRLGRGNCKCGCDESGGRGAEHRCGEFAGTRGGWGFAYGACGLGVVVVLG